MKIIRHHVFFDHDIPVGATHCPQSKYGYSIYRGVLVAWDEDHDTRVLMLLDAMPSEALDSLLVVQEHEAAVSFLWKGTIPGAYQEGNELEAEDGDVWCISSSKAAVTVHH